MNDYIELRINLTPCPGEDATDLLAGLLGDIGFESFVADGQGLTAYIPAGAYSRESVESALADFPYPCRRDIADTYVEGQDWNAEWERHYFRPIVIGSAEEGCVIHSSFHTDVPRARYDITIDPKMAFGTGHHATTSLVAEQLLAADLRGLDVIDMGTGTAILAMLAAMRGASTVLAVEIDPCAHANALENVALNGPLPQIRVELGDASRLPDAPAADLFIANINRNIILGDIASYARTLRPGGTMLLSGFYVEDIPVVEAGAAPYGLTEECWHERDRWVCLTLKKAGA